MKALIMGTGWLLLERLLKSLIGITIGVLVARTLGPEKYGVYAYALTLIILLQSVAALGLDAITVRNLTRSRGSASEPDQIMGTVFLLKATSGLICWAIAILILGATPNQSTDSFSVVAIAGFSLLLQASETFDAWFQSRGELRPLAIARISALLLGTAVKAALIFLCKEPQPAMFAAVFSFEALLTLGSLVYLYVRNSAISQWKFDHAMAGAMLLESWPIVFSGIAVAIYMRADQVFIKHYLGESDVGLYAAVLMISGAFSFLPMLLNSAVAPYFTKLHKEDPPRYMHSLGKLFRIYFIMGLVISVTISASADWLVQTLFGSSFQRASDSLRIHAFTNIFIFLSVAQVVWMINEGKTRISLWKAVCGAATSTGLNILLIPWLGLAGAAWAALAAHAASTVLANAVLAPEILRLQLGLKSKPRLNDIISTSIK